MDDLGHPELADHALHEGLVVDVAHLQPRLGGHRPVEARGQAVDHHDLLAGIDEVPDHVAADIAGTAGNEDGHASPAFSRGLR